MATVLIVDDNTTNLYLLETILRGQGYDVVSARNGAAALEIACKTPPDLIITDILMPVMDGFELCRRWKSDENLKGIPFIFYTATYTDPRDEKLAMSLGADLFILKPEKPEVLARVVLEILDRFREKRTVTPARPLGDEMEILRQYNEALFRKLEKKVLDLEADIAERKKVEMRLSENETFLNVIIENIPDMIFVKDAENLHFVRLNRAAESLLGYSREEMYGKTDFDFFPPEEAGFFREKDREVLGGEKIVDIPHETVLTREKGKRILHTKKIPIRNAQGEPQYLLGIAEDITDRILTEEALQRATRKLNVLNSIIFEEIQNAVFSLSGYLELIRRGAPDPSLIQYIERGNEILRFLEKALSYARIFQVLGQRPPFWQDVTYTFLLAASHTDTTGLSRHLDVAGLEIYADPLLEKVFFFLIENVVRYGGGATEVSLSWRESPEGLILSFEDNGCGIPDEEKAALFETGIERERGFSLFLAREILSITDISLRETGEYGKGTRFEIVVPRGGYRFAGQNPRDISRDAHGLQK